MIKIQFDLKVHNILYLNTLVERETITILIDFMAVLRKRPSIYVTINMDKRNNQVTSGEVIQCRNRMVLKKN